MTDVLSQMEADASNPIELPDDESIKSVSGLADAMLRLQMQIKEKEDELATAKKRFNKLADEDLPQLMIELGVSKFSLNSGETVEIKPTYGAHIKAENKPEAFEWLRTAGHGDLIKNTVSLSFGKGEDDRAAHFVDVAVKNGHLPEQKTDIHPQTLKAWVKERIEGGDSIPMELFGVFAGQKATIKKRAR